jgi:hypothetical protein
MPFETYLGQMQRARCSINIDEALLNHPSAPGKQHGFSQHQLSSALAPCNLTFWVLAP